MKTIKELNLELMVTLEMNCNQAKKDLVRIYENSEIKIKKVNKMKKIIIPFIFATAMIFATTSCGSLLVTTTNDPYDSYYIETSPYYHRQHYYADYYYDRHSSYYQKQHINRNEAIIINRNVNRNAPMRSNGKNNYKPNNRRK